MTQEEITAAMWAEDVERLQREAGCICCCEDHTFEHCPARAWFGCRGNGATPYEDAESWAAHYARYHGMSWDQFFGYAEATS